MKLILAHERSGHAYKGRVVLDDETVTSKDIFSFEDLSFVRMMGVFSRYAHDHPHEDLYMRRTERPELKDFRLDERTAGLLRTDPATAIAMMSPEHHVSEKISKKIQEGKAKVQDSVKFQLRAGYDSLADAFGDFVYLRLRPHDEDGMQCECPFTGEWRGFGAKAENPKQMLLKTGRQSAHADWLPVEIVGGSEKENPKWARVKTEVLVLHSLNGVLPHRFFIPRKWNKSSPWITRSSFGYLYSQYKKEKDEAETTS